MFLSVYVEKFNKKLPVTGKYFNDLKLKKGFIFDETDKLPANLSKD